jgi:hypothetical protein
MSFIPKKASNLHSAVLKVCVPAVLAATSVSCGFKASALNSSRNAASMSAETKVTQDEQRLNVHLNDRDSERLMKVFSSVKIQPVDSPLVREPQKLFSSSGDDLQLHCQKAVSKVCTLTLKTKPASAENFLSSDSDANEHMFHLSRAVDAKRLYSSLEVKEWDLQGSMYKRFTSSDNKMILECILDDERSRCSVFLSNGQSDDYTD